DHEETIVAFQEALADGAEFPPVEVFLDDGNKYWLADGFLQVEAHRRAGRLKIRVNLHQGGRREAILFAVGANHKHGLPRTKPDKHRAVMALLSDLEWNAWSDQQIAKQCHVSPTFVGNVRRDNSVTTPAEPNLSLSTVDSEKGGLLPAPQERTYVNKHGQTAKMKTAKIGKKKGKEKSKQAASGAPESAKELSANTAA